MMYCKYSRIQRQVFAATAADAGRYNPGKYDVGRYEAGRYDPGRYNPGKYDNSGRYVPDNSGAYE